ncbi:hypothetical protein [Halosimplex halobium]|uniref:hypothetical protein n=1 Tax=Halosimplex halobium TaxID=3396618 RepID=UPI003F55CF76
MLKAIGVGGVSISGFVGSSAAAGGDPGNSDGNGKNEHQKYLRSFDPDDPEERKKAVGHLSEIETREKGEHVFSTLPDKRQDAIRDALDNQKCFHVEEKHRKSHRHPEDSNDSAIDISAASDETTTWHCKGVLKNSVGGTEGSFDHYVHWDHSGETVENFSHWKKVKAGGWLTYYSGTTTDYIDNRDDYGVSKMGGQFEACIVRNGCYLSTEIGSGIWVYPNGDYSCNEWDDSTN